MTLLWMDGQVVRVETDGLDRPVGFVWQDKIHRIEHRVQEWQVDLEWWTEQGPTRRDYFAVITHGGLLCVLYHDLFDDEWRLVRLYD